MCLVCCPRFSIVRPEWREGWSLSLPKASGGSRPVPPQQQQALESSSWPAQSVGEQLARLPESGDRPERVTDSPSGLATGRARGGT